MMGHDRTLCVQSLGFLTQARIRRILDLAGWRIRAGWSRTGDAVGIWGAKPVSARGRWVAARPGAPLITVEDGFLRSMAPGVTGAPPLSLVIDDLGFYADASRPSRLERILQDDTPDDDALARATAGIDLLRRLRLSKITPPVAPCNFGSGHVLVVDQTVGDASIAGAGAGPADFARMLDAASAEHPGARILIKAHPDVIAGKKRGHFSADDAAAGDFVGDAVNPCDLIQGARAVYTVSSQIGYEAVLVGVPVRCFGVGFYAGWGLTEDEHPAPRRTRRLSVAELFHGCHLRYPVYYDPWRDCLCDFETTAEALAHQVQAATPAVAGVQGEVFVGVRRWKRRAVLGFRPPLARAPRFREQPAEAARIARAERRAVWLWAARAEAKVRDDLVGQGVAAGFVEDGFLRSVGLGAELTRAASLVFDRQGIYFDAGAPSDLEGLIADAAAGAAESPRAAALREAIVEAGVTKYNVGADAPLPVPPGRKVLLVPGQVEDDASILRGCGSIRTNLALLEAARAAFPDAWLVYKPHPDVEAGLRSGAVPDSATMALADHAAAGASADALLRQTDRVATLTSLMGFEALLRGVPVTCFGTPFYAGWGLTDDRDQPCDRRAARPSLDDLVWAALIAYPAYRDPVSGLACPPELVVERLAAGTPSPRATLLSRLQGTFAGYSWLWRR
ncbi:MAG: capsular polysaccharide biosynthesis protein [Pseudomonadota bacterium]